MTLFEAVFLGLIQGLTEFLPISSSGHLVIGQKFLGLEDPPVLFDILVHCGTLLAIIFYFNKRIINFYKNFNNLRLIFIGSLPAVLVGLFLNDYLKALFDSLFIVGFCLLITAGLLFLTNFVKKPDKDFSKIDWITSFKIGCLQALAILPGVSRSGSTISAGLWRGLKKETAFAFSFYLGAPAMVGALILQIPDILESGRQMHMGLVGLITAALSGFFSLKILEKVVLKRKLSYFGAYCLSIGILVLIISSISF